MNYGVVKRHRGIVNAYDDMKEAYQKVTYYMIPTM